MNIFNKEIHCLRKISPADVGFYVTSATIALYIGVAVILKITFPLWVHWFMGFVFVLFFVTAESMPVYDEKIKKLKSEEKAHMKGKGKKWN